MKRAAIYLRVSTQDQTTSNQEHELRQAAERADWQVAKVYRDHGISGAKGRNGRPAFDALCWDATKRQFDVVMAWNVDRLGRSLKDLVAFLSELHALSIDLFLHQQGLDTTTPAGKAIVEPEVLIDGPHTIERREKVTGMVLQAVFHALFERARGDAPQAQHGPGGHVRPPSLCGGGR